MWARRFEREDDIVDVYAETDFEYSTGESCCAKLCFVFGFLSERFVYSTYERKRNERWVFLEDIILRQFALLLWIKIFYKYSFI